MTNAQEEKLRELLQRSNDLNCYISDEKLRKSIINSIVLLIPQISAILSEAEKFPTDESYYREGDLEKFFGCAKGLGKGLTAKEYVNKNRGSEQSLNPPSDDVEKIADGNRLLEYFIENHCPVGEDDARFFKDNLNNLLRSLHHSEKLVEEIKSRIKQLRNEDVLGGRKYARDMTIETLKELLQFADQNSDVVPMSKRIK